MEMRVPMLDAHAVRAGACALWNGAMWRRWTLGGALYERIVLRVSMINGCAVCFRMHKRSATRFLGEEQLEAACKMEPLFDVPPSHRAALRYAALRTQRLPEEREAAVELARFFDATERRAITALVDLFTFNNRFNNTWEAILPGARQRRRDMGMES